MDEAKLTTEVLTNIKENQTVRLSKLKGGWNFRRKLSALGFVKGVEIEVQKNLGSGPVIVKVKHTRLVLGRGEADKIEVVPHD